MTMNTGNLLHNLILFGRVLHEAGLESVGPARMMDAARTILTARIIETA